MKAWRKCSSCPSHPLHRITFFARAEWGQFMTWIHDLSARKRKKLYTNSSPLLPLAHATRILSGERWIAFYASSLRRRWHWGGWSGRARLQIQPPQWDPEHPSRNLCRIERAIIWIKSKRWTCRKFFHGQSCKSIHVPWASNSHQELPLWLPYWRRGLWQGLQGPAWKWPGIYSKDSMTNILKIQSCWLNNLLTALILMHDQVVAVKQLDLNGFQGNREFLVEVLMLSLLHHPNLVSLVGYCADGEQRLLVYEYMPLGSLADHLLGKC